MKTNFTKENFLVLTNSENKIVAIIQCEKGKQDITKKLVDAIGGDYDADAVIFQNLDEIIDENTSIVAQETILNDFDYEFGFKAIIIADGDEYTEYFTLTFAHVY
jgi:hypothetical protein